MATFGAVRGTPLDHSKVDSYLSLHIPSFEPPSHIQQFSFGQSNPTYFVTDSNGLKFVLRKKPSGALVSKTAHAIEREYRIINAVGQTGKIPVPKVYALCTDESVLGTPFYVMEYLEGRIFTDPRMPELKTKEERTACWKSIINVLAALHQLDPAEIGLGDYASRAPFYPRQIKSLTRVSAAQAKIKDLETDQEVGEIPGINFLLEWYERNLPTGGKWDGGIVHGDFKCDNMIFHPTKPEVIGLLDWELSTLGHPLSDLGNLLQPWYIPPSASSSNDATLGVALRDIPANELPVPSASELLELYCAQVGRSYPLPGWSAAVSFAFFRLAVILQGIAARVARGQASSAQARTHAARFPALAELALEAITRGEGGKM